MLGLNSYQFWNQAYQNLVAQDVTMGLVKPVIFGFIISTVGCYYGLSTTGGSLIELEGVTGNTIIR